MGVVALMHFVVNEVVKPSGENIRVEWHGHCDRGLAVANSMAALVAGAEVVHATACGIGERVGNTQMDQMLVNLKLMGIEPWASQDLDQAEGLLRSRVQGHRRSHSARTTRWWAKTLSAPAPACTRLRSSRRIARTT